MKRPKINEKEAGVGPFDKNYAKATIYGSMVGAGQTLGLLPKYGFGLTFQQSMYLELNGLNA